MLQNSRRRRLETYLDRLYGYAYSLTCDAERAEDLVQDTAVKALTARRVPRDEAAYRSWLFKILRNAAIDVSRREWRTGCEVPESIDGDTGLNAWSEAQEVNALTVRLAFAQLPAAKREILAAIDVAGLTYTEASELFDVPVGTIMSRISRAREALYKHVEHTASDPKLGFLPMRQRKSSAG